MANLPALPWTQIQDFQVAVDAPVSTDLMTEFVVNENFLYNSLVTLSGNILNVITSTGTWTCPAGIFNIKVRLFGDGGGGGQGGDASFNGNGGINGSGTWFGTSAVIARGGNGGGGGKDPSGGSVDGTTAALAPIFSAASVQYGAIGSTSGAISTSNLNQWPFLASAAAGANGSVIGQGGGGTKDSIYGAGAPGGAGEYAEWYVTVVPGTVYTVTIGTGGAGGTGGSSAPNGGSGYQGLVIIEY